MVAIKTLLIVLMMIVPLFACDCQVSVSQKLTLGKSSKTNTYQVTIQNVGTGAAANVILDADNTLSTVTGMSQGASGDNTLYLPKSVQSKGGIPAGSYYQFTYTLKVGQTANFAASCTDAATASSAPATNAPATTAATNAPTTASKATSAPTTAATTAPTQAATSKPSKTAAPTSAPTQAATSKPSKTAAPTTAPTSKSSATVAPTTKSSATVAPTSGSGNNSPSTSTSYSKCATGTWWQPQPTTTWQWQIQGTIDQSIDVQVYDIDLFQAQSTPGLIDQLHAAGRHVICYFSTQYENWRPDSAQFPANLIGNPLDNWAGEAYVNSNSPIIRQIMLARLQLAASIGCDAVEPDNVDSYSANNGFSLTNADGLDYNMFFSTNSHALGLSVGLKNDLAQVKALVNYFDWALNEQCNQYSECSGLTPFITANKAVFNAEYSGSSTTVCPKMITAKISSIFKTLDLTASIKAQCCTLNGCPPAPFTCGGANSKRMLEEVEPLLVIEDLEEANFNAQDLVQDLVQEEAAANSAATTFISVSVLAAAVLVAML